MKACPQCGARFAGGEAFCPTDGSRLERASMVAEEAPMPVDPLIGVVLSERYRVMRVLGEGGMGVVYEAEHNVIGKRVAIKVLRPDVSRNEQIVERFRQEAKSASRIGHENIIDISDFGVTPSGESFLVMEYLNGYDLAHLLSNQGTVELERAVPIILQCCKALGAAHAKGIVHRDMKPENIFLVQREDKGGDFVKIVDFGIAKMSDLEQPGVPGRKLTKTGMIFGTPEYMSPEQAAGKPSDHRVDVYALGIIMYEMFAGRVPFIGESFMEILTQHMFDPPPPFQRINPKCSLPPALEHVIFRSLAKHPNERHQSTRELADELIEALEESGLRDSMREVLGNERPASMRPPSTRPPSGPFQTQPNPSLPPRGYVRTAAPPDPSRPPPAPSMSSMPSVPAIPTPGPSIAPPPSRAGAWIGGIGAVLLVLGIGLIGYVMFRQQDTTEADAGPPLGGDAGIVVVNNNDRDTGTGGQVPPPGADAGIDAGIDAGYDAGILTPDRAVSVGIVSRPSGALVRIEGATACQATPCTVQVEIGRPITLTLTLRHRGRDLVGTRSITPAASQAPLDIVLRPAPRDAGPGPEDGGTRRRIDAAGLTGLRLIDAAVFQREQP